MFNLVGKRYVFLLISLVVIIPGFVSLLFNRLNVGIDFAGGSTIGLRPQTAFKTTGEVLTLLKSLQLKDLQVNLGDNASLPGPQTLWVRLNTTIDKTVQQAIQQDLQRKYGSGLTVTFNDLSVGGKTVTVATVIQAPKGVTPKINDVQALLSKLPPTTDTTKSPTAAPTVTPTAPASGTGTVTPRVTSTPAAKATPTQAARATPTQTAHATPTAGKGTPTASATPTATPTTTSNPAATIPVKVVDIRQGTTTQTVNLLTSTPINEALQAKITSAFLSGGNIYTQTLETASVQGSVAADTTRNAILAVIAASVLILAYVWFAFRKVARPWRYGTCAIIALLHDVLVVLGVFSILGWAFGIQVDALFITALLTVVGFSVHDTIVVFDRIRENMQRRTSETFEQVVNASLVQTMARSLNTSLTVLFTLSALTLFGGVSIRQFTGTLLLGIFSGTYSSIFNASMLLVIWEKGELGLRRFRREYTPDGREVREVARTRG